MLLMACFGLLAASAVGTSVAVYWRCVRAGSGEGRLRRWYVCVNAGVGAGVGGDAVANAHFSQVAPQQLTPGHRSLPRDRYGQFAVYELLQDRGYLGVGFVLCGGVLHVVVCGVL